MSDLSKETLKEETLKELKNDNVKRLRFLLDVIDKAENTKKHDGGYYTVSTDEIYKITFDYGLDPYQTENDLKILVKMGMIKISEDPNDEWEESDKVIELDKVIEFF